MSQTSATPSTTPSTPTSSTSTGPAVRQPAGNAAALERAGLLVALLVDVRYERPCASPAFDVGVGAAPRPAPAGWLD